MGKFISFILRHEPKKIGLNLDENGWADVDDLIQKSVMNNVNFTKKDLEEIVDTNEKKRYSFNEDQTKIRANQGHSISINMEFKSVCPPEYLYHGTVVKFLPSINEKGIQKMSRQFVHLSVDESTALKVGCRHGKTVVLTICSNQIYKDGIIFHCSENGVWLTDYVDIKCIFKEKY
ncbi:RNA 2'-phosphotransferase [Apibacter muscae]|uniref:Probable RNA 2'-phosphotransferase n=1 Tax=Apibacter muscae TaxID=2509004 RepID=A0A563DFY3_9FLAO|nr:RNA 2'-phosphotransferase [Apibacter muscae]TWP29095.1 RNA 2'-phosphotransferase [Apibacter muscae]TWP30324.1 RNA 2'-phosphotransferase [Apibacter muscae]